MKFGTNRISLRRGLVGAAVATAAAVTVLSAAISAPATANTGKDNKVRINQIQVVGTHNSFHVEITDPEKAVREQAQPGSGTGGEEYSHAPIQQQLDGQKVRQLELVPVAAADDRPSSRGAVALRQPLRVRVPLLAVGAGVSNRPTMATTSRTRPIRPKA